MIARRLIVVAAALLLAVQVVRNAAVDALAPLHPESAAKVWAGHPSVEISRGLAEIARASAGRKPIPKAAFTMIDDGALKAPLSPQPFLVRGVQAQLAGDLESARRAFLAAQWRDPRSMPAAYFLATYYFEAGKTLDGLQETVVLARLSPSGAGAAAPFIAAYARDRRNWPLMRQLFRSQDWLEEGVLALADTQHRKPTSGWLRPLLSSLVASGDYARARAIWSSIGGGQTSGSLIFDPGFSKPDPPPPFNWSMASSTLSYSSFHLTTRIASVVLANRTSSASW